MSDGEAEARQQERSLASLERGGLPLSAEARLGELRAGAGAFTSDLSVGDFALCRRLGLRPLSQVMGSSIYQMGYQGAWGPMGFGGPILTELDTLSQALNEVRGRALTRLGLEARAVGADAVVGVQTRAGESELETGTVALEHVAMGTAVRREGARAEHPILTELSVAEYAMLLEGGFEPLGIVAWSSVFFTSYVFGGMLGAGGLGVGTMAMGAQNFELREFTQAVYSAREAVMGRIDGQASALGASGVIGVRIGHSVRPHTLGGGVGMRELRGLMVTFDVIGTAVREREESFVHPPKPTIGLSG
ncbi:MAG TPA: heavy metal-binding domain-containing protein [Solirubrobacteraceae bacterium]|nr:heavy metal-binding domain-containing protein [Solirubrobacteraceae bacterium]